MVDGVATPMDFTLKGFPETSADSEHYYLVDKADSGTKVSIALKNMVTDTAYSIKLRLVGYEGTAPTAWTPYSNICPISGWTGCNISHSGADTSDPTVIHISWQTEAGTVYGGTLDVTSGVLTVNMASVDMGTLTWNKGTESDKPFFLTESLKDVIKQIPNNITKATIKTPIYITTSYWGGNPVSFINTDFDITQTSVSHQIRTRDSRYSTEQEYKTAMSGVQLVYELATPITYQLDPNEINTLDGINIIYVNTGDVTVTYIAKSAKFSFGSPLHTYNYVNLKLFGNTYIEHGKG